MCVKILAMTACWNAEYAYKVDHNERLCNCIREIFLSVSFHIFSIWMKQGFSLPEKCMKFTLHSWNLLNLGTVYYSCTVDSIYTGNQCDTSDFRFGK